MAKSSEYFLGKRKKKFMGDKSNLMNMSWLGYVHPLMAIAVVILCFTNALMGISRKWGVNILNFIRGVHIRVGRSFLALIYISYFFGIAGISSLGLTPMKTPHGYFGVLLLTIFTIGGVFAILVLKGDMKYTKIHGRIMLFGTLLLILQIISGFLNLRIYLGLF